MVYGVTCCKPKGQSGGVVLVCLGWRGGWGCRFCLRWHRIFYAVEEFLPQESCLLVEVTQTVGFAHVANKRVVMVSLVYVVMLRREVLFLQKSAREGGLSPSKRPVEERARRQKQRDQRLRRCFGAKVCVSKQNLAADSRTSLRSSRVADGRAVGESAGLCFSKQNRAADCWASRRFHRAGDTVERVPGPQSLDEIIVVMALVPQERGQQPTVENAPVSWRRQSRWRGWSHNRRVL